MINKQMSSDPEEIRKAWLMELLRAGVLTNHTQTLPSDYKYIYLTTPAFKLLKDLVKKYKAALIEKGILILPEWYTETAECLECDGGSPRQMQLEMMKCLNVKKA